MLQLRNETPLKAHIAVLPDESGADALFVVVKATFAMAARPLLADDQVPVTLADEYRGEPGASSLIHATEVHLRKPGTDVVLIGSAWSPAGRPATCVDVALSVAGRRKMVRVFGNRQWTGGRAGVSATLPQPFTNMPLIYERAFGGAFLDASTGKMHAEERNPVGVGLAGPRNDAQMSGLPLPNLEDPAAPFRSPREVVPPMSFGFVAPSWLPRRAYAGTYDEAWQQQRAPYLPADFDARFFNAASSGLSFDHPLQGGEPVQITNASPEGAIRFQLPALLPAVTVRIAGRTETPAVALETVLIEPDLGHFCLTWRAMVPCDKAALKVEEIAIDAPGLARTERAD